jgi:hypothetical protein
VADSDHKFIETYCRDIFSRPFARRFRYLYLGLDRCDDTFVLSDTKDTDFKYCEPMQATGLVKVHNPDHLAKLKRWLQSYGLDGTRPYLFYFGLLLTLFNKTTKETFVQIRREPNGAITASVGDGPLELIARPIDAYFVLTKLQSYVDKYSAVFFKETIPTYAIALENPETITKLVTRPVACQDLYEAGFLDIVCRDINLVLLPGLDMLTIKALVKTDKSYTTGIKLWSDSAPRCLNYGGFYTDQDVSLCVVRDNTFIFPKPKPE